MKDYTHQYKKIISHHGTLSQCRKAIEELGELIAEISLFIGKEIVSDNLASEIADCKIMIDQLEIMFDLKSKVDKEQEFKVTRTLLRINGGIKCNGHLTVTSKG